MASGPWGGQGHAFFYNGSSTTELGTLGGDSSFATNINNSDYVVGFAAMSGGGAGPPLRAFVWHDDNGNGIRDTSPTDEMRNLGTLGGNTSIAYDINSSGYVVGRSDVGSGTHAFIWHDDNSDGQPTAGELKDLNTLVANLTGWSVLQEARAINDGGQIVGWGTKSNGETHAFLLTPAGFTPPPCPGTSPSPTPTPANQTITVNTHAPANAAYNSQFTVAATASSGLDVTYSSAGACTNSGATFMITSGTGTCTVKYDQAGNANYNAAPQVTENVTAQKASATITLGNLTQVFDGSPKFATASTTPAGLTVNITYSQNGNPVSSPISLGAYAVSAVISDANYQGSTTGTLNIVEPAPVILLETGTSNAAAVDSVTFFRGPFRVTDNFNFSGDHLTRIIIFTLPLANPDQTLSVKASGIDLPIESGGNVTGVSGLNASYIIVKLPQGLQVSQPTTFGLTVTLRNVTSNTADLIITP